MPCINHNESPLKGRDSDIAAIYYRFVKQKQVIFVI
jgi:hypothetical protein